MAKTLQKKNKQKTKKKTKTKTKTYANASVDASADVRVNAGQAGSATGSETDWALRLIKDVWPQERDFMERPERYRYVRKLLPPTGCVFCEAARAEPGPESLVLTKDQDCMVVMNKYPYNSGHLLVVPLQHIGNIWDLDDGLLGALAVWLKKSVAILREVFNCPGFNLGLNHGAVAGAGIPDHLHWHIVPRWGGDTNFFPLLAETKVLPETLEQTYSRLYEYFAREGR